MISFPRHRFGTVSKAHKGLLLPRSELVQVHNFFFFTWCWACHCWHSFSFSVIVCNTVSWSAKSFFFSSNLWMRWNCQLSSIPVLTFGIKFTKSKYCGNTLQSYLQPVWSPFISILNTLDWLHIRQITSFINLLVWVIKWWWVLSKIKI